MLIYPIELQIRPLTAIELQIRLNGEGRYTLWYEYCNLNDLIKEIGG